MASTTPSPNASPSAVPPASGGVSSSAPPSLPSPTNSSTTASPPSQPNQTPNSPDPSAPPPSPPQAVPAEPPPSPPISPPPSSTPPPTSPPPSPPPPPASLPPSVAVSPPPPPAAITAPPPAQTSPSLPKFSPPPPVTVTPPPQSSEVPPKAIPPSPPPPANVPRPPSTTSPPPPREKPPETTPSPPLLATPPPSPSSTDAPPPSTLPSTPPSNPSTDVPPPSTLPSTPPSVSSPPVSLPGPPSNNKTAAGGPTVSLPSIPTEKPTARPTNGTDVVSTKTSASHSGGLNTGGAVAIGIIVGFIVLSLLVMAVWFAHKKKKKATGSKVGYAVASPFTSSHNSGTLFLRPQSPANFIGSASGSDLVYSPSEPGGVGSSRSWFTYEELIQATNGFSAQNLLGEGGFGCVYKGLLIDGREVAVKQLKVGGGQGEREFQAEVEIISRVHHRHLVSLVGYCISEHQRLLVYDYVPNNTLHYHLHDENRPVLDWPTRVKVATGAARGIAYLHEDCHPRIIHRDIKSSNILLDHNFEAQVSDFGLAKLALELDSYTHVTTRVMGTFGYMAPEYATSGKLTEKSDVYSFGVMLLELITGRKPVDTSQPVGDESLVEWARPLLSEALDNEDFEILVDPRLEKNYNRNEMFRMIEAAAACVRHSAIKRPKMSQVVRALDSLDEFSDLNNGMKPGQSSVFDSAQQSAQIRMFRRMAFGSQDSSSFFNESLSSWRSREPDDSTTMFPQNKSGPWNSLR